MLKSVIYLTLLLVTNIVVCKPDYLFNAEADGWLKLHKVPATWHDAFLTCHYEGAVLASPINSELAAALRGLIRSDIDLGTIYIGANALFSQGDYISIEGIPLADMEVKSNQFVSLDNEEKPEDCLRLSENGKMYSTSCNRFLPYVCYKKRDETTIYGTNICGTFDNGYRLNESTGKCYKLHEEPRMWNVSYKICAAEGGHLVIINDKQEADAVVALFPPSEPDVNENNSSEDMQWEPAHIGLRDWNRDSYTWLTIHGDKIENVYNTWAEGQPDNKGVNVCGCILQDGTLDDNWCTLETKFICEKDPLTSRFELVPVNYWYPQP